MTCRLCKREALSEEGLCLKHMQLAESVVQGTYSIDFLIEFGKAHGTELLPKSDKKGWREVAKLLKPLGIIIK